MMFEDPLNLVKGEWRGGGVNPEVWQRSRLGADSIFLHKRQIREVYFNFQISPLKQFTVSLVTLSAWSNIAAMSSVNCLFFHYSGATGKKERRSASKRRSSKQGKDKCQLPSADQVNNVKTKCQLQSADQVNKVKTNVNCKAQIK